MKKLLVQGGGTAGTMVVNKLRKKLNMSEWSITIVDKDNEYIRAEIDKVVPEANPVLLTDGRTLDYDQLVIATGTRPCPAQIRPRAWMIHWSGIGAFSISTP